MHYTSGNNCDTASLYSLIYVKIKEVFKKLTKIKVKKSSCVFRGYVYTGK